MHKSAREKDSPSRAEGAGQYLSFTLDGEHYGVDILKVQEIRGWEAVREIPETPAFIKGVLDLRGCIVPIVDLRQRFRMAGADYSPTTVIVVLSVGGTECSQLVGAVVDGVSDVLDVQAAELRQAPSFGARINTRYMRGMLKREERMIILLDVDRLFDHEQLSELERIA